MRRIVISALAWTGFLFAMFGMYFVYSGVYSGLGLDISRIWFGVLILAMAFLVIHSANRLGWDGVADLDFVVQLFQRSVAAARKHISPVAQEAIQPDKKSALRRMRPPIKLHRYLLTISVICFLFAFVLEMIERARGMPMFGHAVLDMVAYVFLGIGAFFYLLTLLLDFLFFLRGRR
jgi:hypothetical protein